MGDASKILTNYNKGIIATADQDLDYKCRELLKQKTFWVQIGSQEPFQRYAN